MSCLRFTCPSISSVSMTLTPFAISLSHFSVSAVPSAVVTTIVGISPAVCTILESSGILSLLSQIILIGFLILSVSLSAPFSILHVSIGSSASTVPMPAIIPLCLFRSSMTYFLEDSPVIHLLAPVWVAILPSMVMAYFMVTYGCLLTIYLKKIPFMASHSALRQCVYTSIPASLSLLKPFPATIAFGSSEPQYTFLILCSIIAFTHGGCLPKWQHGSSVTYITAPSASAGSFRLANAARSAWSSPYLT